MYTHVRVDGIERVTGTAKYTDDWKVPGMLYGRVVTSQVPHGRVRAVDVKAAKAVPGVKAVISALDSVAWHSGERAHGRAIPTGVARFLGDCVGAVAATTRRAAIEGASRVVVTYDELPDSLTIEQAMQVDAPRIWEDGNVTGPIRSGFGDVDASFAKADVTLEEEYTTQRTHSAPLEPAASLAWWDDDKLTVVSATQAVFGCRKGLAEDLGVQEEKVRVICYYKGGGFGQKSSSMDYDLLAAILAKKTGRPVKVEYTRQEDFTGLHARWSTRQKLRAAATLDGRLLAMDVKAYCDVGAYSRRIPGHDFVEGPENYYNCEAWRSEVYGVYTNTPATGHVRAPPGPQSCFAAETLTDEMAHRLEMDPLDFRQKNAVALAQGSRPLTSNGLNECLERGSKKFGWSKAWRRPPKTRVNGGSVSGVGMAMASWHTSLGRGEASLKLREDGILEVYTGVVDIGTGAKSTMAIIAAQELGYPLEKVRVVWGDTRDCPYSIGESGSRTTSYTGAAVSQAAKELKWKLMREAAAELGVSVETVKLRGNQIVSSEGGRITIRGLLRSRKEPMLRAKAVTERSLPGEMERLVFAAHFAEVDVDLGTGEVSVARYVAAHESGKIVNKLTAESQVQGGVVMGIGMALTEDLVVDSSSGGYQNPSLLTYAIPDHKMVPRIETILIEAEDPYGFKSIGEIGVVPVPAAVGNAIFNATGRRIRRLPFTPRSVIDSLKPQE